MNNPLLCASLSALRNPSGHRVVFTQQPKTDVVTLSLFSTISGANFSASATASNGAAVSYQWQRSTNNGQTWANLSGETSSTLSVSLTFYGSNGYLYRVIATAANAGSATSDSARLVVLQPGFMYYCGDNAYSLSGDLSTTQRLTPTKVGTQGNWSVAVANLATAMAINSDGQLFGWGWNAYGQLGIGSVNLERINRAPTRVGTASNWTSVAIGYGYCHAINSSRQLWSWGRNTNPSGLLGNNGSANLSSPTQIGLGKSGEWGYVDAYYEHSAALVSGELYMWGKNLSGQLGDGTTTNRTAPTRIGTIGNWKQVAVGFDHTVGITTEGELYAWGANDFGQLGTGTTQASSTPVRIAEGVSFRYVDAGGLTTFAISDDQLVYSCGLNNLGRLGYGNTGTENIPQLTLRRVAGLEKIVSVHAGKFHGAAVSEVGSVFTWGYNHLGQLGDGTTTTRATPQAISPSLNWMTASCGANYESLWIART